MVDKFKPYLLPILVPLLAIIFSFGILYGDVKQNTEFRLSSKKVPVQIATIQKDIEYLKESLDNNNELLKDVLKSLEKCREITRGGEYVKPRI